METHCGGSITERVDERTFNRFEHRQHLVDVSRMEGAEVPTRLGLQCAICSAWRFPCPSCAARGASQAARPGLSIGQRLAPHQRLELMDWASKLQGSAGFGSFLEGKAGG